MKNKSRIIIGCMTWGRWGKQLNTKAQSRLIEYCVKQGNKYFDHADIYGDYTAEAEFGIALKESSVKREELHLTSKCGLQLLGETRDNRVKHYELSKEYIIWSAEESLKKLQTDYLDTFLIHRPSPLMQADEIAEAIAHLKDSGKIKQFGVSNFTPAQMQLISSRKNIGVNQIECSLTHPLAMTDGTLDMMQQDHIKAQAWSPMGTYFKINNEQTKRIKSLLVKLCKKYEASENTLLLSWLLKHPANISPVIGTTTTARINEANAALGIDLDLEDWFLLLEASTGEEVP